MNGSTWIFDALSGKTHHPDCQVWLPSKLGDPIVCNCDDLEDELIAGFTRTPLKSAPVSAPQGPYQSLASLIRAARTAGLLKPIQQYGGGHAPAPVP